MRSDKLLEAAANHKTELVTEFCQGFVAREDRYELSLNLRHVMEMNKLAIGLITTSKERQLPNIRFPPTYYAWPFLNFMEKFHSLFFPSVLIVGLINNGLAYGNFW